MFSELKNHRALLYFMVRRDVVVQYKQTLLGLLWAVINPLLSVLIYYIVFSRIGKIGTGGIPAPLFYLCGLIPWLYFSQSVQSAAQSLISQGNVMSKVYFPRIFIPLTPILAKLIDFIIASAVLAGLIIYYSLCKGVSLHFSLMLWWLLPLVFILLVVTVMGFGLWLSALSLLYRDVRFVVNYLLQLLMFLCPVVFSYGQFQQHVSVKYGVFLEYIFACFPLTAVIEGIRASLFGGCFCGLHRVFLCGSISAVLLLVTGYLFFKKTEKTFADRL